MQSKCLKICFISLFFLFFVFQIPSARANDIFAYICDQSGGQVSVLDTSTNTLVGSPIVVDSLPQGVAVSPDGTRVYVTSLSLNTVSIIDTATNTLIGSPITVGGTPEGIAVSPDGTRAYVSNISDNTVSVIDTTTDLVIGAPILVAAGPYGIATSPDGLHVYVGGISDTNVSVIDTSTLVVTNIYVGFGAYTLAVTPDSSKVYATNLSGGTVAVIDTATNTVSSTITVGGNPFAIAITPDGTQAYVTNLGNNNIAVIDIATDTLVNTISVGGSSFGISITPDSAYVYVTMISDNKVAVIDTVAQMQIASVVMSSPATVGNFITPAPFVSLSDSSLTFSSQELGTSSSPQSIQLTNSGNGILAITSISASGDFSESDDCGSQLLAFRTCNISVTFTPSATGSRTGTLTLTDNASGSPQTISLSGTGTGGGGGGSPHLSLSVTASSSQVEIGGSLDYVITIVNTGDAAAEGVTTTGLISENQKILEAPSSCSGDHPLTCSVGSIAAGETINLNISAQVLSDGMLSFEVSAVNADSSTEATGSATANAVDLRSLQGSCSIQNKREASVSLIALFLPIIVILPFTVIRKTKALGFYPKAS